MRSKGRNSHCMLAIQTSHCHLCLINIGMYEMSHARCCSGSTVFRDKALSPSARGLLARRAPPSGSRPRRTRSSSASRRSARPARARLTAPRGRVAAAAPRAIPGAASQCRSLHARTCLPESFDTTLPQHWVCRNSLTLPCFLQIVQISILGMYIIFTSK